jgi:invasion protein IalB
MARGIFVNYRRDDSAANALSIAQYLEREFGSRNVFIDVDRIRSGDDFPVTLAKKLEGCGALIAVIGPSWLSLKDETGRRRLDDPEDWVRLEIEQALERKIPVIPVVVGGATLPKKLELPAGLQPLAQRHALTLTTNGFRHEMAGLAADVRALLPRKRWIGTAAVAAVVAALLAAGTYFALTRETPPPPPDTPKVEPGAGSPSGESKLFDNVGTVRSKHANWEVRCGKFSDAANETCAAMQAVQDSERPNVGLLVIALYSTEHKLLLRVAAPVGVLMSAGLGLKIDGGDVGRVGFVRCTQQNCIAEVNLEQELLDRLKSGKTATFIFFETPDKGVGIPVELAGFGEAVKTLTP